MPPTKRRPCEIDTSRHFCPHAGCDYRGWRGLGNLRANGHPSGGPWRQLYCRSCHGYFLETHGTLLHGKRLSVELIVHVLACLAEGLGIRATARVFEVDPNTVLQPLQVPEPTNGTGSAKRWRPCTPAMAAGLTDHVWTLQEVLCYRVPPWPQPHGA